MTDAEDAPAPAGGATPDGPATTGPLAGRAGWLFVGLLVGCLVGFPTAILIWPPTFVPYTDAYLALSLVPGLLLGAAGAWTAVRGRR
ncbi:MAG: hypothetical protein ABEJ42_03420 [Halobacteriaceae archaeon]